METNGRSDDRRIVKLLTALVALTGVLVLGLASGGALLWREYARVRSVVSPRDLAEEVSRKQQAVSSELAAMAKDSARQIAVFERRAAQLRSQGGGPISAANKALEMTQLMADEMLLQLKLMTTLDSVLEKTSRPLPAQREILGTAEPRPAPREEQR